MKNASSQKPSMKSLGHFNRKPIGGSREQVVSVSPLAPDQAIPIVVRPVADEVDLALWAEENREFVKGLLLEHRAVLFRGFDIKRATDFKSFVMATSSGDLLEYTDRSTPRNEVDDGIYVSTIYPADQRINLHNEGTYWMTWPLKIYFCCLQAPEQGGQTPIADVRSVLARIDPEVIASFIEKRVMYVRNYNDGFGLTWQDVFQTQDPAQVEAYCRENEIDFEWKALGRLRTKQIRPAVRRHPRTREQVWFNHAAFFHICARDSEVRRGLLELFDEQDLPYMTYYGDGAQIAPSVVEQINEAYKSEKVVFQWQEGDILMLDNMSVAHGREPYKGDRQIIVAMAEPYRE